MSRITINRDSCERCGRCASTCPSGVLVQQNENIFPDLVHEELCISCGHCVAICHKDAINHPDYLPGSVYLVDRERLPSFDQTAELLRTRRSIRAFKDQSVAKTLIERIIDGARYAPSGHNSQSSEFVVVQDKDTLKRIAALTVAYLSKTKKQLGNPLLRRMLLMVAKDEIRGVLHLTGDFDRIVKDADEGRDSVLYNAPCLLLVHGARDTNFSEVNANLAVQNAMLACQSLGLGSFYAGYVASACKRDNSIPLLVSLPEGHQIFGALCLGHPKFRYSKWMARTAPKVQWL
jgi:nitroreductase/NAD-dependent dihydropyrimidine dehydrogenase PreA subunit